MNPEIRGRYRELVGQLDVVRLHGLHIDGIEVTQAIQHYRSEEHLIGPDGRAPDNAIRLIAGKPALVRVYVRSGVAAPMVFGVTGELEVLRGSPGMAYSSVAKLSPANGSVMGRRDLSYATERGSLSSTLNFAVPAWHVRLGDIAQPMDYVELLCGHLRFRVTIQAPGFPPDSAEVDLDATLRQTLRVRAFLIRYFGPATSRATTSFPVIPISSIPAPTLAELRTTATQATLMFPVQSKGAFSVAGTTTWSMPLDDPASDGGCSANWNALLRTLQQLRVEDGNRTDWLYYGLLPALAPVGVAPGMASGCGHEGLGASPAGLGMMMAHELGHACELQHAPCGPVGLSDPSYPAYRPYDLPWDTTQLSTMFGRGSIGEYGLDTASGTVASPSIFRDFMSYCGPSWISLHNYQQLLNHSSLAPQWVCRPGPFWNEYEHDRWWWLPWRHIPDPPPSWLDGRTPGPERLISIIGVVRSAKDVEVSTVVRVEAFRTLPGALQTHYTAELIGAEGRAVASAPLYALQPRGCGSGCSGDCGPHRRYPFVFQAFVSDLEPGTALAIRNADEELWTRPAPQDLPAVSSFRARAEDNFVHLDWDVQTEGASEPHCWAQWSSDEGRTWQGLTGNVQGNEARLEVPWLPSGAIQLRFFVSDGFHTAVSETVTVEIPNREPQAGILAPRARQSFIAGHALRIWGFGTGSRGEELPAPNAQWFLDGHETARGFDAFIEAPEAGEHRLTLLVESDSDSARAEASVEFETLDEERGQTDGL